MSSRRGKPSAGMSGRGGKQPTAAKRGADTDNQQRQPLSSPFSGHLEREKLPAPFDRHTTPNRSQPEEVVVQNLFKSAIVTYDSQDGIVARGSFNESSVKFFHEKCATSPSIALKVKDRATGAHWMIDFDLYEMTNVTARTFEYVPNTLDSIALSRALEAAGVDHKFSGRYCRITLTRREHNMNNNSTDYAMFCDERVGWAPTEKEANNFPDFLPFQPEFNQLSADEQELLNYMASTEKIEIWLNNVKDDVQMQAKILHDVSRSGRDSHFRPDWYWTLHKLYRTREDTEEDGDMAPAKHFQKYYHPDHITRPREFPERQPWLQIETNDDRPKYASVWRKTKTRFSGPSAYRCTYIPSLLWEMEATAVMFDTQFTNEQTYFAAFQLKGDKVLVKIRVRGPDVATTHNDMQVVPNAGISMDICTKDTNPLEFHGFVAEKVERGWDAMVLSELPQDFQRLTAEMKKGVPVLLKADYRNAQDDLALMAIDVAASTAEIERKEGLVTTSDRLPWKVSSHTGGAHVSQKSRDYYQDWLDRVTDEDGDMSSADRKIKTLVTETLFDSLNIEQKQAFLLALRGTPKSQLGLEGCPGTGKSRTLGHISLALIAMGYSMFLSAQSNNGVDAVFEKIVKLAEQHGLEEDLFVRVGASTIDRRLVASLLAAWSKNPTQDVPTDVVSAIATVNIAQSLAYKIAKFIFENPTDSLSTDWHAWARSETQRDAQYDYGSARRPAGVTEPKSGLEDKLLDKVLNSPRLFAATAAAAHRRVIEDYAEALAIQFDVLIFDEASQSTEASFMTAATARIMKGVGLIILGGDTKQLPPVIKSTFSNPFGNVLQMSPLERMILSNHDSAIVNLVQNYRSHRDIVRLASKLFYNDRMVAGRRDGDADNLKLGKLQRPLKDHIKTLWNVNSSFMPSTQQNAPSKYNGRIWVLDVPGFSRKAAESHSSYNENGIRASCLLAKKLAERIGAENVQVITMYSYEVGLFRKSTSLPEGVAVQTVDSFQGLEDVAVILHCSAAFNNRSNPVGHISNEKRLNVALTRARELMFIVGNITFWEERLPAAGRTKDSAGVTKFHMEPDEPFLRLITEAQRAKMVVKLEAQTISNLPDVYVKRGQMWKELPPRFKKIADANRPR